MRLTETGQTKVNELRARQAFDPMAPEFVILTSTGDVATVEGEAIAFRHAGSAHAYAEEVGGFVAQIRVEKVPAKFRR